MDPKSKRCIFIGYRTNEYTYRFWDSESHKILRHMDVVFNKQKTYIPEGNVEPQSTPEQQGVADLEFIKLEDASVDKARNIPEGNVES